MLAYSISRFQASLRLIQIHKALAVPLLAFWVAYGLLWLLYWQSPLAGSAFGLVVFCWLVPVVLFTMACLAQLKVIEQIESDKPIDWKELLQATLYSDLKRALPGMIIASVTSSAEWIFWLGLTLLSSQYDDLKDSHTARVRVLFLLPAIVWEGISFSEAEQKSKKMLNERVETFSPNFGLSKVLPLLVLFGLMKAEFFPFSVIVVSAMIYMEQIIAGELYLWYLRWYKAVELAPSLGREAPTLEEMEQPSLLNGVPDLLGVLTNNSAFKPQQ